MTAAAVTSVVSPAACAPGTPLYGEVVEFLYREAEAVALLAPRRLRREAGELTEYLA